MRIIDWDKHTRPAGFGSFEITWELFSGIVVRAMVKFTDPECRNFTIYLVELNAAEAKLMSLEPGYNILIQGVNYGTV